MASVTSRREHLVEELNDLLNAEEQLIEALPQMAAKASTPRLKAAVKGHLAETRGHKQRAAQALRQLGEEASGQTCKAMKGLLEEEIATYGTIATYLQVLGERGVARLMAQTLRQEKAADRKLTSIAEGTVNKRAAKEYHEQEGMLTKGAQWIGSTVGSAMKKVMPRAAAADRSRSHTRRTNGRSRKRSRSRNR
jgi:ferritin-like metal-binding protein YciE